MKNLCQNGPGQLPARFVFLVGAAFLLPACASPARDTGLGDLTADEAERTISQPPHYNVSYFDENRDDRIDRQYHTAPGMADADYQFEDRDFDGRYDLRTDFGYAASSEAIDKPVPEKAP